jgi:hypothetical protein
MKMSKERRCHPRFPVTWLVLYGNKEVFGQGTVLNVSQAGCQVAAMMPVAVGMRLKLWIFTPHREDPLYVGEARVRWAKVARFGLELRRLLLTDHRWLVSLLETAERRTASAEPLRGVAALSCALPIKTF